MGKGAGEVDPTGTSIKRFVVGFNDVTNSVGAKTREINGADTVEVTTVITPKDGEAYAIYETMTVDKYIETGSENAVLDAARRNYHNINYSEGMRARLLQRKPI